jgi:membrane-associated phospholipid phosphatase
VNETLAGPQTPPIWRTRRRELLLAAALGTGMHVLAYYLANHFPRGQVAQLSMTVVDRVVPFLPWTVFLYLSDYLLIFVSFLLCRSKAGAIRFLATQLSVIAFATLMHWAVPIAFPRELYPLPPGLAALPALAMDLLRGFDAATSCMPSLHVAGAVLAALLIRRERPKAFPWLLTWAAVVAVSTLTTKQHYLLDVLAGVALAVVAVLVAEWVQHHPHALQRLVIKRA